MIPDRIGKVKEYKSGDYYLTIIDWDDGHQEIEIHSCVPLQIFHSYDSKDLPKAIETFNFMSEVRTGKKLIKETQ